MSVPLPDVWLWQQIVSPHMAGLASALAERGCRVTYVAAQAMSDDRIAHGWTPPSLGAARLEIAPSLEAMLALARSASVDAVHLCQGIRGNDGLGKVQRALAGEGRKQWVVMESVDDRGLRLLIKRPVYRYHFLRMRRRIQGVLAIGYRTRDWVVARGMPEREVFSFAYFLRHRDGPRPSSLATGDSLRVVFVGQFNRRKRFDLLLQALGQLTVTPELVVVGSGPLEDEWRAAAERALPGRVRWIGRLPIDEVPAAMGDADCLVLPSQHDGWGAVVSEAMGAGTPVVCSDACGSAGAVLASGEGAVFRSGDSHDLASKLDSVLRAGITPERRSRLQTWAAALQADAGASYLLDILRYAESGGGNRPLPPWQTQSTNMAVNLCVD